MKPLAGVTALLLLFGGSAVARAGQASVERTAPRIVNGLLVQDRPAVGALLASSGVNLGLSCSGTLVGCRTFLTAAHCVCAGSTFASCGTPAPSSYTVYLQDIGLVGVAAIDVDPTYDFGTGGDVAVLRLASITTGVPPMPINTLMRPPTGTAVEIAGYGVSRGGANDTGLLRRGMAETSLCTAADEDFHVCWTFTDPLGMPGEDSNTCNGDSGGPALADLGAGVTVVGVTSGGVSSNCLPFDASYDSDVFVHSAFIETSGGADLDNATCGSISQVGEPATTRATFEFETFTREEQSCRSEVARQAAAYTSAALKAWQSCLDGVGEGTRAAPCPDARAGEALAAAALKVDSNRLASRCPGLAVLGIGATGACATAMDANDLAGCIVVEGDAAVAAALSSEYADDAPDGVLVGGEQRACQQAVAKASGAFLKTGLKLQGRCQRSLAAGKTDACPNEKSASRLLRAEETLTGRIVASCSHAAVSALDAGGTFGGTCAGATTDTGLAACEAADHAAIRDGLVGLLDDEPLVNDVSFEVPPGTATLRVTLNGLDNGANDLDLYLRAGAPASPSDYDDRSEWGGVFEETEVPAPVAGTWHAHIRRWSGDTLIPWQLTATSFAP